MTGRGCHLAAVRDNMTGRLMGGAKGSTWATANLQVAAHETSKIGPTSKFMIRHVQAPLDEDSRASGEHKRDAKV